MAVSHGWRWAGLLCALFAIILLSTIGSVPSAPRDRTVVATNKNDIVTPAPAIIFDEPPASDGNTSDFVQPSVVTDVTNPPQVAGGAASDGGVVDDVAATAHAEDDAAKVGSSHEPLKDEHGRIVNPIRKMDAMRKEVLQCPRFHIHGNDADRKKHTEHIVKYSRYASDYCNSTGLMQMNIPQHAHIQMLSTIARVARIKQNDRVLDWGCGCGTMLNYLHLRYNTTGVGLDMTEGAIRFAWQHSQPQQTFCWMDGSDMTVFPSSHFDAIVSWGGVYHVRRTQVQCSIVTHMVRILKPGGVAFVGHIRTDKSQQYWKQNKCNPPNSSVVRYRDWKTFRQSSWKRHGFFSLIVTKLH